LTISSGPPTSAKAPGPPFYFHILEDGTAHASSNQDLVEERPSTIWETSFEGTKVFFRETLGPCINEDDKPDAIYEIHLLENGNLEFVVIEDPCPIRSSLFQAEFAPVP
jgi:hypothetical protein